MIDHREIYEECERRRKTAGFLLSRAHTTQRLISILDSCSVFLPAVITYRKDLWETVGATPESWDEPCGRDAGSSCCTTSPWVSVSRPSTTAVIRSAIMYSFGASEQDADGNPALKSKETLEVIKYVKALYEEAMFRRGAHLGSGFQQPIHAGRRWLASR